MTRPYSSLGVVVDVDLLTEPGHREGAESRPRAGGPAAVYSLTLPISSPTWTRQEP